MSVINQVLNQLEQRGAHTNTEQTMVRAVPDSRRHFALPWLAFAVALLAGIAGWQWTQKRLQQTHGPIVATGSVTANAGESPVTSGFVKPTPQPPPADISAPLPVVSGASQPASRLSFELKSVQLPSTFRQVDSAQGGVHPALVLTEERSLSKIPDAPVKKAKPERKKKSKTQVNTKAKKTPKTKAKAPPKEVTASNAKPAVKRADETLPMKQVSAAQRADAEFRKAVALMQQGRIADALAGYQAALLMDPGHDAARQALVALLLESKRGTDAERVLQERLDSRPDHTGFTMMLARLQVERGEVEESTMTLEKGLPYANSQADYHAFLAALLQRKSRHDEAIAHYQIALQLVPNNGIWLMGYGISLQAKQRNADARDAFKQALDSQNLSPDLQAFVQQKLKGL